MIFDIDTIETAGQSATAIVCDNAALFGATPGRDEFDTRKVWDEDDAVCAVTEAFRILSQGVAPDGYQIADERESLLWGFVNMLHAQTQRLDCAADRLVPELRDLQRGQDGTEIRSLEMELTTDRARCLGDRRDAFETLRNEAAEAYRVETGDTWRPRPGSHTSQTGHLTSTAIDARDFVRARKDRKTQAHLPQGTLVASAGGKDIANPAAVIERLDKVRAKYADMVLVHGGGPGVEKIATSWAERNGVHPDRLQARLGPPWTRRTLPPQRRTAQPPAEGRHRLPRLRHHREPRRQGAAARHPGAALRRVASTAPTGRVVAPAAVRPVFVCAHRPRRRAALPPQPVRPAPALARLTSLPVTVTPTLMMTTMVLTAMRSMAPNMDAPAHIHPMVSGASLRDRAIRSNLRSLTLPAITAPTPRASAPCGRCALRLPGGTLRSPQLQARHCRGEPRPHRPHDRHGLLAPTLRAALVGELASLALAGYAGCAYRLGSSRPHSVRRR